MLQKEILEYNKLCAEFMKLGTQLHMTEHLFTGEYMDTDSLQFHSDWNWIMEVVEAIDKIQHTQLDILGRYCRISSKGIDFKGSSKEDKKEAVVQAIHKFLIWYKENNK